MADKHKNPKAAFPSESTKKPKLISDPDNYLKQKPVWSFSRCDKHHDKWSLCKCNNLWGDVLAKLSDLETQTWAEIMSASGGRSHGTSHHAIDVECLSPDARKRLIDLKLTQIDQVFSIALTGQMRLIGLRQNTTFCLLWWDPEHEVCPSKKKHT